MGPVPYFVVSTSITNDASTWVQRRSGCFDSFANRWHRSQCRPAQTIHVSREFNLPFVIFHFRGKPILAMIPEYFARINLRLGQYAQDRGPCERPANSGYDKATQLKTRVRKSILPRDLACLHDLSALCIILNLHLRAKMIKSRTAWVVVLVSQLCACQVEPTATFPPTSVIYISQ